MTDEPGTKQGPEPTPWERQTGETTKAFEAFVCYRDLGPERSIRTVARKLGRARSQVEKWARATAWVQRVEAYEVHLDRLKVQAQETDAVEVGKAVARTARNIRKGIDAIVAEVLRRVEQDPEFLREMPRVELVAVFKLLPRSALTAAMLERLGLGLSKWPEPKPLEDVPDGDEENLTRGVLEDPKAREAAALLVRVASKNAGKEAT